MIQFKILFRNEKYTRTLSTHFNRNPMRTLQLESSVILVVNVTYTCISTFKYSLQSFFMHLETNAIEKNLI